MDRCTCLTLTLEQIAIGLACGIRWPQGPGVPTIISSTHIGRRRFERGVIWSARRFDRLRDSAQMIYART